MRRDPGDICDRFTIALLKWQRIGNPDNLSELLMYADGILELLTRYRSLDWLGTLAALYQHNHTIWELESDLRQGKIDNDKEECGVRAIQIRDINAKRVAVKNAINRDTREGAQDVKQDHLSAKSNGV